MTGLDGTTSSIPQMLSYFLCITYKQILQLCLNDRKRNLKNEKIKNKYNIEY